MACTMQSGSPRGSQSRAAIGFGLFDRGGYQLRQAGKDHRTPTCAVCDPVIATPAEILIAQELRRTFCPECASGTVFMTQDGYT